MLTCHRSQVSTWTECRCAPDLRIRLCVIPWGWLDLDCTLDDAMPMINALIPSYLPNVILHFKVPPMTTASCAGNAVNVSAFLSSYYICHDARGGGREYPGAGAVFSQATCTELLPRLIWHDEHPASCLQAYFLAIVSEEQHKNKKSTSSNAHRMNQWSCKTSRSFENWLIFVHFDKFSTFLHFHSTLNWESCTRDL